jgi:PAS domain S-box-containing protein
MNANCFDLSIGFAFADPQPLLIVDHKGRALSMNPAMKNLTGTVDRVPEDADNSSATADAGRFLPVNIEALVRACLDQQRPVDNVEARYKGRIYLWALVPHADKHQVLLKGRDATRELDLQDQAVRSNRLYRLITENTTDLISRHAPDGRFIDATPASWRLLGYWPEDLRGRLLEDLFPAEQPQKHLVEARNRLSEDGYAIVTAQIMHRDGTPRWFEIASRAIRETYTGAVVEVISVSRDISARVASEENNRRLADELAHAARLATLGELASSIAHEMNQPLASIVNFASASQRFLKAADKQPANLTRVGDGLTKVIHHANRASEVIRRLRAFLRKGRNRAELLALNQVASNVALLCQWEADKHRMSVVCRLPETSPTLTADPVLLEQVLINLVRNAIEANVEARVNNSSASVIVLAIKVNDLGETLVEVTDQGPGLNADGIRQMFQPFYTSKPDGLGLGLSMSRSIVEGFGGFLDAYPAPTGGLMLVCRFPPSSGQKTVSSPREELKCP